MTQSNLSPELHDALADALRESTGDFARHPEPEQLEAYAAGRLSEADREAVQDHLSWCCDCVDLLTFDPQLAAGSAGVLDFETGRAWREIEAHLRASRSRRELDDAHQRLRRQRRYARFSQVAAAVCLATAAAALLYEPPALTPPAASVAAEPQANVEIVDVTESNVRRGLSSSDGARSALRAAMKAINAAEEIEKIATPVVLEPSSDSVVLIFALEPGEFDSYVLTILDASLTEVWKTRDIAVHEASATLSLPRDFLAAGDYHVTLDGRRGSETTAWEYFITVDYR